MKTPFVLFSFELAVISTESMTTNATKTFIGESSLTGANMGCYCMDSVRKKKFKTSA